MRDDFSKVFTDDEGDTYSWVAIDPDRVRIRWISVPYGVSVNDWGREDEDSPEFPGHREALEHYWPEAT